MLSKPAQYGRFAHSCLPCFMEGGGCEEPGTTGVCIRAVECSKPSRSVFFSSWSKNIGETLYSRRFHTRTLEPLLRIYIYIYIYIRTDLRRLNVQSSRTMPGTCCSHCHSVSVGGVGAGLKGAPSGQTNKSTVQVVLWKVKSIFHLH